MGAKKIRLSKKEIAKAKEPVGNPVLSREWLQEHLKKIIAGVAAVAILAVVVWGVDAYGRHQESAAREAYAQILQQWPKEPTVDRQTWEKLIAPLQEFIKKHPRSAPAINAKLSLGQACFYSGQYDAALQWTKEVLERLGSGKDLTLPAYYQVAAIYQTLGKVDDAVAAWNRLKAEAPPELQREAAWNLALLHERKGDEAKALEYFEEALKTSGAYPPTPLLQGQIASLRDRKVVQDAPQSHGAGAKQTN